MYVYGKNVALEVLKRKDRIKKVFLCDNFTDTAISENLKDVNVIIKTKKELDRIANENHQGIIFEIKDYVYKNLDEIINKDDPLIVILDHITDPHNLGAIIRTCEAAKVDGIIIPKNRSALVNGTVMKTSAGTIDNVDICLVANLNRTIEKLKKEGFWIIGTDMMGSNYKDLDYKGKTCIVIGSEGFGMSRIVKEKCDFIATIPMKGTVNSLNASVAAGIIIFEATTSR